MKNILSQNYLYLRIFKTNWDLALPLKSLSWSHGAISL